MSDFIDHIDAEQLDRYLAGLGTDAERTRVTEWLNAVPARAETIAALRQELTPIAALQPIDPDAEWERFVADQHGAHRTTRSAPLPMTRRISRIAAVVAAAACVVVGVFAYRSATRPSHDPAEVQQYSAGIGERARVTLNDGTRVLLNAGSTLRVADGSRDVELRGEALFTVSHRSAAPFIVRSGGVQVTVLGTTFAMRRYPEDRRVRIVVTEGRVSVRSIHTARSGEAILDANMLADVSDSGQTTLTANADADRYLDWTRGTLVFRATPVREAFPELERRYGLQIHLSDSTLATQRITVTVTNDPPTAVLDAIALALNVRYVRDGNVITFLPPAAKTVRTRKDAFPTSLETTRGK